MKVLYVIPGLGVGGGAERSLLDLAPGMAAAGIDLEIVYFHDRPSSAVEAFRALGIPVRHLGGHRLLGRARVLRSIIRTERPDIVHTTLLQADLAGRLAAWRTPAKVLGSLVSTNYEPARQKDPTYSFVRVSAVRHLEGWTLRHLCDHVHANSEAVKASAIRRLGVRPDRISVVHRGRDPEAIGVASAARRAAARTSMGLVPEDQCILSVGRHEFQKGHLSLFAALPTVVESCPHARVVVAGREGTMTPRLREAIAEAGLTDRVDLLGHRPDVPELLAGADVFVLPSLLEGLPGAMIEAMALGVPIVASAIPSVTELVDDRCAVLVEPQDSAALAAGLIGVLGDPLEADRLGAAARERFLECFTIDQALAGMVALYRNMLDLESTDGPVAA